jgi:3-hydroxyacyl-[acyl-carrier-protein] dehydratase
MSEQYALDHKQIAELLPHRSPLLLVDRVLKIDLEKMNILARKCVSGLDPVFAGHFPGDPVFPGVYIVEGLAQASGLLCFKNFLEKGVAFERRCLLTTIEEARFRRPIVPGDVMEYDVSIDRHRGTFAWFNGVVRVEGEVVAEAKFSALLPLSLSLSRSKTRES